MCVQQVAISNYRIILILGFRGGWVNRRRDLRFHAYLRPTLEFFERILERSGEKEEVEGVGIIAATRSTYTRILPFTNSIARPLEFSSSSFDLALFSSSFSLTLMDEKRGRETAPDWFTRYRLRKPRFYSSSLFALLFFSFSCWSLSLDQFLVRLKKSLLEWYFNTDSMDNKFERIDRSSFGSILFFIIDYSTIIFHIFDRWNEIVAQLVRFDRLVSKSKVPRLAARLRPGYLVRWQAGNARTDWTGPRTPRHDYLPLPTRPRGETQQLINARSRNAISASSWPASPTRDSWARSNASSTCIFFFFSPKLYFETINRQNWYFYRPREIGKGKFFDR